MALPTRLILTNLSPSLTPSLLRSHLLQCPPTDQPLILTDLKILQKQDGTSRRIAFVGFRNNQDADRVRKWAEGSWVRGEKGGSRIRVDWAKETQDAPPPRKRQRKSPPPSTTAPISAPSKPDDSAARFEEFMALMAPKKRTARDVDPELGPVPSSVASQVVESREEEEMQVIELAPEPKEKEEEEERRRDDVVDDETISDLEYMQRRMKRSLEDAEKDEEEEEMEGADEGEGGEGTQDGSDPSKITSESPLPSPQATLLTTSRLFIRNLPFSLTTSDLSSLLTPSGPLSLHIPLDPNRQPKGLAYATYERGQDAVSAYEALDGKSFMGRLLHIIPAVSRTKGEERESGVKEKKEMKKKEAIKGISWATLYMNTDAALDSVAQRLKVDKATLLDPSNDNAAVRVALAESHVIGETKKYFESEGVDLKALTLPGPRSPTTILIKNLPYDTSTTTLQSLFKPFGKVNRILVPPSGMMAIVEMDKEEEARDAWRGLSYKKVGGGIVYLEKGPRKLFGDKIVNVGEKSEVAVGEEKVGEGGEEKEAEPGATLFIKNLSFGTTSSTLSSLFSSYPTFLFARVQQKPDPKKPGQMLSMGFGFVGFREKMYAEKARVAVQGRVVDGHMLEIRFANRGREEEKKEKKGEKKEGNSTKLIVKNLPFEITRKEVRELFSSYGTLKSVRLPRKFDHKTRGFAFLDFLSHRDAENAFHALEHSHLLGRHMVIQWAKEEEDEGELRRKAAVSLGKKPLGKRKFVMEGTEGERGEVEVLEE